MTLEELQSTVNDYLAEHGAEKTLDDLAEIHYVLTSASGYESAVIAYDIIGLELFDPGDETVN